MFFSIEINIHLIAIPKYGTRGEKNQKDKWGDPIKHPYHIGDWTKYNRDGKMKQTTCTTKGMPWTQNWIDSNKSLFEDVSNVFKFYFEELSNIYQQVLVKHQVPYRPFRKITFIQSLIILDPFGVCVLNNDFQCKPHVDKDDWPSGYGCVLPFGNFQDGTGNLSFPFMKHEFLMRPGCLLFFKTKLIEHLVRDYIGIRRSLVLFTDNNSFLSPINTKVSL